MGPSDRPSLNGHAPQAVARSPFQSWDPIMLNQLAQIQNLSTISRRDLVNQAMDPRRNIDDECGYPSGPHVPIELYRHLYDRWAIPNRVVQVMAKESFQQQPTIYETEDPDEITPFEEGWDNLQPNSTSGQSWHQDEKGSNIWDLIVRADINSGIGHFGIILLGIDDGRPLQDPVDGVITAATANMRDCPPAQEEMSRLIGERSITYEQVTVGKQVFNGKMVVNGWGYRPTQREQAYWDQVSKLTTNEKVYDNGLTESQSLLGTDAQYFGPQSYGTSSKGETLTPSKKERKLVFIRTFDESMVQIIRYEWNINNPRFGMPIMYSVTFNDPRAQFSGVGLPMTTMYVHWTRVIHLADNLGSSEVFGTPRMQPVLNHCLDLRKIYAADGESYWRNAFMKLSFETHPTMGGDVVIDEQKFQDTMENAMNGGQQWWWTSGLTAKSIAPMVSDPTPHIAAHIEAICIQLGIPVRVFKGSERGELASSQDDASWNDRLRHRQDNYISPRILVPLVDRLIMVGVLPQPAKSGEEIVENARARGWKVKKARGGFLLKRLVEKPLRNAFPPPAEDEEQELQPPVALGPPNKMKEESKFVSAAGYTIQWPDLDSMTAKDKAQVFSTRVGAYAQYLQSGMEQHVPPMDFMTQFDSMTEEEAETILENAVEHQELMLAEQEEEARLAAEEAQALADEQGFDPTPPDGFEKPEPGQPPVKVKAGEKLVFPENEEREEVLSKYITLNVFCSTGNGGGIDPSCPAGSNNPEDLNKILGDMTDENHSRVSSAIEQAFSTKESANSFVEWTTKLLGFKQSGSASKVKKDALSFVDRLRTSRAQTDSY